MSADNRCRSCGGVLMGEKLDGNFARSACCEVWRRPRVIRAHS